VPTIVVAYSENRQFWVPSPWAFYSLLEECRTRVPELAGYLLASHAGSSSARVRAALARTTRAAAGGLTAEAAESLCTALARTLAQLEEPTPAYGEGVRWLQVWSRVASAARRDPVDAQVLAPYLDAWRATDFFKLMTANARRAKAPF
jgi:hypothetical protein